MKTALLILSAGYGEGHNAAARAIAEACVSRYGDGSAPVIDALALATPRGNAVARRAYLALINGSPGLWRLLYRWLDQSRIVPSVLRRLGAERRVVRALVAREQPRAICCTFPGYAYLLKAMTEAGELTVPYFNVVTDSISINSLWWRGGSAGWYVPNAESAEVLHRAGIDAARVHVTGFPVQGFFSAHATKLQPPDLAAGARPRVLYIVHSGRRRAPETAERLLRETDWEITCTVGRDDALRARVEASAAGRTAPTTILGWTNEIPRLLMTHHVLVSKAGGATTQEALAARCPMIVNQIVPGQEEGNYELLRRHGVGGFADTPEATLATLRRAFAERGRQWREWRAAIEPLHRPDAAGEIVDRTMAALPAGEARRPQPLALPPVPIPA
jgi:processive 1,2-diacylglycerol beta-glucosyltransferase